MAAEHLTVHQLPGSKTVTLYCGRCTGALHLALPVPAAELMSAIEQFTTRHACCDVPTKD
jgi:hypothetical protein